MSGGSPRQSDAQALLSNHCGLLPLSRGAKEAHKEARENTKEQSYISVQVCM